MRLGPYLLTMNTVSYSYFDFTFIRNRYINEQQCYLKVPVPRIHYPYFMAEFTLFLQCPSLINDHNYIGIHHSMTFD